MSASLHIPKAITADTPAALSAQLIRIQADEGGRVAVISIYFDTKSGQHVLWYYPIRNLGGGLF